MVKGTPSKGRRSGKATHAVCRRCGRRAFHMQKRTCAACGFGESRRLKHKNWMTKRGISKKRRK